MKLYAYNLIRNSFSQESRTKLKKALAKTRKKGRFFYRMRYGSFTSRDLREELESKIRADFDILMVHCSYDDLIPMYSQGLNELLQVLLDICAGKTLAMPAFFFGDRASSYNVGEYYRDNPCFDVRLAISHTGLLSELFRRHPGVKRSLHPTQSICAFGPLDEQLVSSHHTSPTSFGVGTPFGAMATCDTVILGIGSPYYRCLTQIHAPEDLLGVEFPFSIYNEKIPVVLIDEEGEIFKYSLSLHRDGMLRDLGLVRKLLTKDELMEWKYHAVPMFCTTAKRVTDVLTEAALRGETIYGKQSTS
jgi:aminoglycoside 3-N-acetyltransferase